MKLTIDSTEALEDTLRVVGALYNVSLEVRDSASTPADSSDTASETTTTKAHRSRRKSRSPRKRQPRTRQSRSAANGHNRVDTAAVRTWARDNGYEIADRGRVSANVVTAYQQAQLT